MKRSGILTCGLILLTAALVGIAASAQAQTRKPNILIFWGDDIGWWNISAYNHG